MMLMGRPLPKDVTDKWPEVFSGIKINAVPLKYLHAVLINFKDGKVWEIRITAQAKRDGWSQFEQNLSELVRTYDHRIETVEFKLETILLKKDIEISTKKFLRKQKL